MSETSITIGLSAEQRGFQCGADAARQAMDTLGGKPIHLAILFTSHHEPAQVLKGVNNVLGDVPVIGANSAGQYTDAGYVEHGAGLMLIHSQNVQFHPHSYTRRWFKRGRMFNTLNGISEKGLGSPFHHRALMLFPDDHSMNLDGIVDQAMTETAMLYDILGGPGPTIPAPPRNPVIFFRQKLMRTGIVGAELLSQQRLGLALANGWTPLAGPFRATRVEKRTLNEIDGRPAREVYEDFLDERSITFDEDIPHALLLQHPIGICSDGTCKVSVLMGFDAQGGLMITSPPPENALFHILGTQPAAMTFAARRAVEGAMGNLETQTQPAGALLIDCMSTAMVLEDAYVQQREAFQQVLGDVPFLGYRSHGVLARLQGQLVGHYECSVAAFIIPR